MFLYGLVLSDYRYIIYVEKGYKKEKGDERGVCGVDLFGVSGDFHSFEEKRIWE